MWPFVLIMSTTSIKIKVSKPGSVMFVIIRKMIPDKVHYYANTSVTM